MQNIDSNEAPKAIGLYSQAIANGFIFLDSQIAIDPTTQEVIDGGVKLQTELVLRNISGILRAVGLSMENIVHCVVLLRSMDDFSAMNEAYATFFKSNFPARSTVAIDGLPKNCLIKIAATALDR
jgi:2-iminobutanoate/2-iminopropanoate deaminase